MLWWSAINKTAHRSQHLAVGGSLTLLSLRCAHLPAPCAGCESVRVEAAMLCGAVFVVMVQRWSLVSLSASSCHSLHLCCCCCLDEVLSLPHTSSHRTLCLWQGVCVCARVCVCVRAQCVYSACMSVSNTFGTCIWCGPRGFSEYDLNRMYLHSWWCACPHTHTHTHTQTETHVHRRICIISSPCTSAHSW